MSQSVEEIQKLAVILELEAKSFDKQMTSINKVISWVKCENPKV